MSDTEKPEETPTTEREQQESEAVPNDEVRQADTRGGYIFFFLGEIWGN